MHINPNLLTSFSTTAAFSHLKPLFTSKTTAFSHQTLLTFQTLPTTMYKRTHLLAAAIAVLFVVIIGACSAKPISSLRLIHRFSDEAGSNKTMSWPERKSFVQMQVLLGSDLKRQKLKPGSQNKFLVVSQGSQTFDYGNDLGWLHYTWIDIGTPSKSFLVALDTGSDTSWVPCGCVQCAPLSLSHYSMLDKELSEYNPAHSNSSKSVACSHELCQKGPTCKTPKENCPYTINYLSQDTSSSGFLFEDKLHLASVEGNKVQESIQPTIIIGCGNKQSGDYLNGPAPDGLMGLGPGDISVPSLLSKSGLVSRSFSFCYDKSYSGTLFFGDQGPAAQRSTPFLSSKEDRTHYFVEVETFCVGKYCLKQTGYRALVDTGSSFTYIPEDMYELVVTELDKHMSATRITKQNFDCWYKASSTKAQNIPSLKLVLSVNQSFIVENPMLHIVDEGEFYCLGAQSVPGDTGIIGQNFLMGYRVVFDLENSKLGWSSSNCQDIANVSGALLPPPKSDVSPVPLPTDQEQQKGHGQAAVAPAVAGRTSPSASLGTPLSTHVYPYYIVTMLLLVFCTAYKEVFG